MCERQYNVDEINDRHIKQYRNLQIIGRNLMIQAIEEILAGRLKKGASTLKSASKVLNDGIKGERKILGLSIKPNATKANKYKEKSIDVWQDLIDESLLKIEKI